MDVGGEGPRGLHGDPDVARRFRGRDGPLEQPPGIRLLETGRQQGGRGDQAPLGFVGIGGYRVFRPHESVLAAHFQHRHEVRVGIGLAHPVQGVIRADEEHHDAVPGQVLQAPVPQGGSDAYLALEGSGQVAAAGGHNQFFAILAP